MITMELRRVKRDRQTEWKMKGHLSLHALGSEAMSKFVNAPFLYFRHGNAADGMVPFGIIQRI